MSALFCRIASGSSILYKNSICRYKKSCMLFADRSGLFFIAAEYDIPYEGKNGSICYTVRIRYNTAINLVDITYRLCYTNTRARS